MTIVETSNVGVKVGMVGRGVMDAVGVAEGSAVRVGVVVGSGDEVVVGLVRLRRGLRRGCAC